MDNRKIKESKNNIKKYDEVYEQGISLIKQIDRLVSLIDQYKKEGALRTSYSLYEQMEDGYVFDLIKENLGILNSNLSTFIKSSYGLEGIGYLVDEIQEANMDLLSISTGSFSREINSGKMIMVNKLLRDLKADIKSIENKIELLEKRELNNINRLKQDEQFDEIIENIKKLGDI